MLDTEAFVATFGERLTDRLEIRHSLTGGTARLTLQETLLLKDETGADQKA